MVLSQSERNTNDYRIIQNIFQLQLLNHLNIDQNYLKFSYFMRNNKH